MPAKPGSNAAAASPAPLVPLVPLEVLEATRSLLQVTGAADARRIAENLVLSLGGRLVAADTTGPGVIPADVSFGHGDPVLVDAPLNSPARDLLDRHLNPFLLDARQALELSGRSARLAESASTDVLTGLPNRRALDRALGRLTDSEVVVLIDLDHFKQVNDTFGHAAGDEVLRVFGKVLGGTMRVRDQVGRYGGEEFLGIVGTAPAAEALLERVRTQWLAERPLAITFSAGLARSTGDPDATVALADEALYRAKDAGRDQWLWAASQPALSTAQALTFVEPYLFDAVAGRRQPAVGLTLDLLDSRVSRERIVGELLAVAQREVGDRWHRNQLTSADEHLATGVAGAALDALSAELDRADSRGVTVVTCAEGDWHSLAAQMFGESLRALGCGVHILGASTPVEVVAEFLTRSGADSLAISCTLPIHFPGAASMCDAAHRLGLPVLMGGQAFGGDARRAERLGADAWAQSAQEAAAILVAWRADPPQIAAEPTRLNTAGLRLLRDADALTASMRAPLAQAPAAEPDPVSDNMVYAVQFLGAAMLAEDPSIYTDYIDWLAAFLGHRDVTPRALLNGLSVLQSLTADEYPGAAALLDAGRAQLLATTG
jgi:diguanylate cyclase (GGDEF)-like protein